MSEKKFGAKIVFGARVFLLKFNCGLKQILVRKYLGFKKMQFEIFFWSKRILGPQKFRSRNFFGQKQILWSGKIVVLKNFEFETLLPKKILVRKFPWVLGLSWAKLSSNWNWAKVCYITLMINQLPLHILSPINL